ncbi:hypothetical protein [Algibacter pacificus]|uniref:hypothetical protein n=1 Tax=Algibacter pacificus TaxID=2599389 RepID=UPI0011CCC4CF|nr:hypothetical protein [Algibacter pacificus]
MKLKKLIYLALLLTVSLVISCDSDDDNGNDLISLISGTWTSNFDEVYTFSEATIESPYSTYTVVAIGDDYIICQNDVDDAYNPSLYSKFVFTNITDGNFNYCQSFFSAESQEEIENAEEPSDSSNLESGCGGFSWSYMTKNE